jgi:uncharacterized membrane protein YeaQ/YmgE (transglycosylase-associated protein family)
MEMLFSIMAGVFVGWLAGRALGHDEFGRIVTICFGGAGAIAVALLWTIVANRNVGTSASPEWIVAGLVGGVAGIVLYRILWFLLYRPRPVREGHSETGHH